MSQRTFLDAFDKNAHASFAAAGLADTGAYTAPGTPAPSPVTVRVLVDRAAQQIGEFGTVSAGRVEVRYLLADVAPEANGKLLVDGDTYINMSEIDNDGSMSRWLVRRG